MALGHSHSLLLFPMVSLFGSAPLLTEGAWAVNQKPQTHTHTQKVRATVPWADRAMTSRGCRWITISLKASLLTTPLISKGTNPSPALCPIRRTGYMFKYGYVASTIQESWKHVCDNLHDDWHPLSAWVRSHLLHYTTLQGIRLSSFNMLGHRSIHARHAAQP